MAASKVRAPRLAQPVEGAQTETGRSFSNSFTRAALTALVMEGHACTTACLMRISKTGYLETPLPTPKPALSLLMKRWRQEGFLILLDSWFFISLSSN